MSVFRGEISSSHLAIYYGRAKVGDQRQKIRRFCGLAVAVSHTDIIVATCVSPPSNGMHSLVDLALMKMHFLFVFILSILSLALNEYYTGQDECGESSQSNGKFSR